MSDGHEQWMVRGLASLEAGDAKTAAHCFGAACDADGTDAESLNFLGVALQQLGRLADARSVLERAAAIDPDWADPAYNLAEVLTALGETVGAASEYERCVAMDPEHPAAWRRLFHARVTAGGTGAAVAGVRAVAISPLDRDLASAVGKILAIDRSQATEALPLILREVEAWPDRLGPQVLLYKAATVVGESELAVAAAESAAEIAPNDREVLLDRISVLSQCGQLNRAIDVSAAFVKAFPDDRDGHSRLAVALVDCQEFGAGSLTAERGDALRSDAHMQLLLGSAFFHRGRTGEAIVALERAIQLGATPASEQRLMLALILESLGRREEAITQVRLLLESEPEQTDGLGCLGTLLVRQGKLGEGRAVLERALARDPNHMVTLCGLGNLAALQADPERAWELFQQAIAAAPTDPFPCVAGFLTMIAHPNLAADALLGLHLEWARRLKARTPPPDRTWANDPDPGRRLRIGYASPDLRGHSVAYFTEPLLAAHDRAGFEIVVFDSSPAMDNISQHFRQMVDGWVRVVGASDDRVAELVREHRIDILVDLAGHTSNSRVSVFARRPAPVQVSYLGYPNTTGLSEIDYRLTDAVADPPGASDQHHVEQLVRLPGGFLCFRPPAPHPPVVALAAGTDGSVTFASFNAIQKVNGAVIALWSRVLRSVDGSTLLMKAKGLDDPETQALLQARFDDAGVEPGRVRFVDRVVGYTNHLETYNRCDIALDTFPYNGTATTCEALWMGLPVVAMVGDRHVSRVSLSILTQVGLPELAATSADDFVRIAAGLANDRPRLATLRASLRGRMLESTLMDGKLHAQQIEAAYRSMWRTWCDSQQHERAHLPQESSGKLRLLVEGWRFLPHSYAVVNQWQCLELASRPEVELYHRDRPLFNPNWKLNRGLFSATQEMALNKLRPPPADSSPDVVYRIAYRMDITPRPDVRQTVVFGTVEMPGMKLELIHKNALVDRFSQSPNVVLVTPSNWSRDGMVRAGADAGQVHVIPHGVDVSTYRPLEEPNRLLARKRLGFTAFTFLHVGAMTWNKGCDLLLKAFAQVCHRYDDVLLIIKGSDSLYHSRQMLDQVMAKLSAEEANWVRPRIRYVGGVLPMSDMACLYAAADAYVCPYRAEGFNLPALEAVACGRPVICTAGGPTDEFTTTQFARYIRSARTTARIAGIEHEELLPDVEHLAYLMQAMVTDEAFQSQAAAAGPDFVKKEGFTWTAVVDRLLALLTT